MPCAQYEALEARRHAQCERGIAFDKETDPRGSNGDKEEDQDEPPKQSIVEARVCKETIDMFQSILLFSQGAAQALYDNQMIMSLNTLQELNKDTIKDIARTIRKPGGDAQGFQISKLFVSHHKLFAF